MDGTNKALQLIFGDVTLGIKGADFHYIFSYQTGGPESLVADGREWLYRTPRPTFWRALTDNDRGNGFHLRSGMWLAADQFIHCKEIQVERDGQPIPLPIAPENNRYQQAEHASKVSLSFRYQTITVPSTSVQITYTVEDSGKIAVDIQYEGKQGLPELPVFGLRLIMPTVAAAYRYEGLSGETYPDRMAGGVLGVHQVEGLPVTPYLVPQDCGMHMETKWLEVYRSTVKDNRKQEVPESFMRVEGKQRPFAFSCLPYTAEELENATHQEELPAPRRTVLCVNGAVRGVGGIDSWGAEVEQDYCISGEESISYSFVLSFGK